MPKTFSPEQKDQVMLFAETHSCYAASNKFNVPASTIQRWKKSEAPSLPKNIAAIDKVLVDLDKDLDLKTELMQAVRKDTQRAAITSYSAACAFASLSSAAGKIHQLKMQLLGQRQKALKEFDAQEAQGDKESSDHPNLSFGRDLQRAAEITLVELAKLKIQKEQEHSDLNTAPQLKQTNLVVMDSKVSLSGL